MGQFFGSIIGCFCSSFCNLFGVVFGHVTGKRMAQSFILSHFERCSHKQLAYQSGQLGPSMSGVNVTMLALFVASSFFGED